MADYFSPSNVQLLNDTDDDLGAAGPMLIPGTNLLVTGGKQGIVYLLDRTQLGHSNTTDGQIPQSFNMGDFGIFNMALWNRADGPIVYLHIANSPMVAYRLAGNRFPSAPSFQSLSGFNVPFQGMTVSASGVQPGTGVLWVLHPTSYPLPSHAVLTAYNADDLTELWNSDITGADGLGVFSKFANPTVANGKVYAPTASNQLVVYGLIGGGGSAVAPPAVTGVVNAASYAKGPIAPGEIVAIFGQSLGPQSLALGGFNSSGLMATQISGTQVTFNGVPAPLLYTSWGAVAAIVPYEDRGRDRGGLPDFIERPGYGRGDATGGPGSSGPLLGRCDRQRTGRDSELRLQPELSGKRRRGRFVCGGVRNRRRSDQSTEFDGRGTSGAAWLASDVSVTVGGKPGRVLYAGNAGGEVAGALQVNVELPAGISGQVPVVLTIAGQSSQSTVIVSVQ